MRIHDGGRPSGCDRVESLVVTHQTVLMLLLLAAALAALILDLLPMEVTAGLLLCTMLVLGFVDLEEALSGLSNKAVITIACMLALSHALVKTGLLEWAADHLSERLEERPWFAISIMLVVAGLLSGFLNNTAIMAIMLPLAVSLCQRFRMSPSKVLIPLSYASILGGTLTLVGTSTNLLVASLAEESGQRPFGMFEFTPMGAAFLILGLSYIVVFARRLLPARAGIDSLTGKYHMSPYLTEIRVPPDSNLIGRSCRDAGISRTYDIVVLTILRNEIRITGNPGSVLLKSGDILIVRGAVENILRLRDDHKVHLLSDIKLRDREFENVGEVLLEGLLPPTSSFVGRTLKEIDFHRRFGSFVLAIRRHRSTLRMKISRVKLQFADALLILAPQDRIETLRGSEDLVVLSQFDFKIRRARFWWLVLVVIPAVVLLAALDLLDITRGALLATALLLAVRAIEPRDVYQAIDWSVILLIAAFLPIGQAMVNSGAAHGLAAGILFLARMAPEPLAPIFLISLTYLLTSLLTQFISNNAAAIMLVPIALELAQDTGISPRPLLMAICFAASAEFMTPMGYQTNAMAYAPGKYRFIDYTRFGAPLNLLFWITATLLIPVFWPL